MLLGYISIRTTSRYTYKVSLGVMLPESVLFISFGSKVFDTSMLFSFLMLFTPLQFNDINRDPIATQPYFKFYKVMAPVIDVTIQLSVTPRTLSTNVKLRFSRTDS